MRARLVSADGGPPLDLVKDVSVVGRGVGCDVRLDYGGVSRLHCVIVKTDGLLVVRDLGSTNGTRVNGQPARRAALLPNDVLAFGSRKYLVKFGLPLDEHLSESGEAPPPG
ncbi:MAG: FHA domain-containing protein [Gemmataceae bacterium]|nr:FHA domain-containing protein [Gemmataceae bacterium]